MAEKMFLTGAQDFDLSRQLAATIFCDGFFPNLVYGIWKGGTPPAITIHDSLKALARYHGFPEPRFHNAVKAEEDGSVQLDNLGPLVDEVQDGDKVLVVGNVFKKGRTIDAVIEGVRSNGRSDLDVRSAVQIFHSGVARSTPDYFALETDQHVVFPYQMDHLTDDEIRVHRPEVAGFLLDDKPLLIPTPDFKPGTQENGLLFVTDEIYRMSRELALKAYLDGVRPTFVLGVWRGGTPIAISMYDMFVALARKKGFPEPRMHNVVRAESYDLTSAGEGVRVQSMSPVLQGLQPGDIGLKCDDVYERGTTDLEIKNRIRGYALSMFGQEIPIHGYDLVIKPDKVVTGKPQDGTLYTSTGNLWFVFPHGTADWCFNNVGTDDAPVYRFKESTRPLLVKHRSHLAELFQPKS